MTSRRQVRRGRLSKLKVETKPIQKPLSVGRGSLALALMLLGLAGCSADSSDATSRRNAEFEGSHFCKDHGCRVDGERGLDRGGLSRSYRIRDEDSIVIHLDTWGSEVFGASMGLYGQARLRSNFLDLASEFFPSVIGVCRFSRALQGDLTRPVSALMEARPHRCGPWEVRAGRVLRPGRVVSDYIISAER